MIFAFTVGDVTADFNPTPSDFCLVRAFACFLLVFAFCLCWLVSGLLEQLVCDCACECWCYLVSRVFVEGFLTVGTSFMQFPFQSQTRKCL